MQITTFPLQLMPPSGWQVFETFDSLPSQYAVQTDAIYFGSLPGYAAQPANDFTNYSVTTPQSFTEFSFLQSQFGLGAYIGSLDSYNQFSFYLGNTLIDTIAGSTIYANAMGNWTKPSDNLYVLFESESAFNRVILTSSQFSLEADNFSIKQISTSEPDAVLSLSILFITILALGRKICNSK